MIDPLRHRAMVVLERDDEARLHLHGRAELDRRAACVRGMQGAPLVRDLDPFRRQAGFVEKGLGLLQILFAEDAHAHALGLRLAARAFENEAVMTRLGDAAKIERIPVFVADDEAEEVDVEVSAHRQILHGEHRVARARDVEGRIVDGPWNAHGALQLGCRMGNRSRARFCKMESAWAANSACSLSPFAGGEGRYRDRGPVVGVISELWRCPPAALWRRERTFVWRRRLPGWQRDRDFAAAVWRKSLRPHRSRPRRSAIGAPANSSPIPRRD